MLQTVENIQNGSQGLPIRTIFHSDGRIVCTAFKMPIRRYARGNDAATKQHDDDANQHHDGSATKHDASSNDGSKQHATKQHDELPKHDDVIQHSDILLYSDMMASRFYDIMIS